MRSVGLWTLGLVVVSGLGAAGLGLVAPVALTFLGACTGEVGRDPGNTPPGNAAGSAGMGGMPPVTPGCETPHPGKAATAGCS